MCIIFGSQGRFEILFSSFSNIFFLQHIDRQHRQQVKFWLFNNCRRVQHEIIIAELGEYLFDTENCFTWIFQDASKLLQRVSSSENTHKRELLRPGRIFFSFAKMSNMPEHPLNLTNFHSYGLLSSCSFVDHHDNRPCQPSIGIWFELSWADPEKLQEFYSQLLSAFFFFGKQQRREIKIWKVFLPWTREIYADCREKNSLRLLGPWTISLDTMRYEKTLSLITNYCFLSLFFLFSRVLLPLFSREPSTKSNGLSALSSRARLSLLSSWQ